MHGVRVDFGKREEDSPATIGIKKLVKILFRRVLEAKVFNTLFYMYRTVKYCIFNFVKVL